MQKINQEEFRIEKVIKKKGNKLYVNEKDMIIHLIAGLIKKHYIKASQYIPKPCGGTLVLKLIYLIMQQKQI